MDVDMRGFLVFICAMGIIGMIAGGIDSYYRLEHAKLNRPSNTCKCGDSCDCSIRVEGNRGEVLQGQ